MNKDYAITTISHARGLYGVVAVEKWARHLGVEPSDNSAGLIARECLTRGCPVIEHFGDCEVLVREIVLEADPGTVAAHRLDAIAQVSIFGIVWDIRNRTRTPEGGVLVWARAVQTNRDEPGSFDDNDDEEWNEMLRGGAGSTLAPNEIQRGKMPKP